jgi:hypothetical protein
MKHKDPSDFLDGFVAFYFVGNPLLQDIRPPTSLGFTRASARKEREKKGRDRHRRKFQNDGLKDSSEDFATFFLEKFVRFFGKRTDRAL